MTPEFRAGPALETAAYEQLVQRAIFDCCKWNLTAHDTATVCRFPILVTRRHFAELAAIAEALAAEALEAEHELLTRPELHGRLAIPRRMLKHFRSAEPSRAPRYLRVDFHPTREGYRITEANTDVAGAFIEASGISKLWAKLGAGTCAGDPADALAAALQRAFGPEARIGLLHLTRYVDDVQVTTYLARRMEQVGLEPVLFDPAQLRARLRVIVGPAPRQLDAIFRFFPGEWLEQLPAETAWQELVGSGAVCNPVTTMLTQSKRFPLVWPELEAQLKTWRALLPETVEPGEVTWPDARFVLKPALGHEGFGVSIPGISEPSQDRAIARQARRSPARWVAQRRFAMEPIETPDGPRFVCLGVYVVDGRAAGASARVARRAIIDDVVQDAVLLLEG